MGFFDNAWEAMDGFGQEATRRFGPAVADAWENAGEFAHEAAKLTGPAAADARRQLDKLGQEVGKHAAPIAKEALKSANAVARLAGNHLAARQGNALPRQAGEEDSDWQFIQEFGEDMAKRLGSTADEFWQKMSSSDFVKEIGQKTLPKFEFTEEDLSGFSERLRLWILAHPIEFATLLACIAAGPIVIAITPAMLGLFGFTPLGIATGSVASGIQSGIGHVAAGSAFAILTSAGMGGYGIVVVHAIAASPVVAGTCSAAAVAFLNVIKENEQCRKEKQD